MTSTIPRASPISANKSIEAIVGEIAKRGGRVLDLGAGRGHMTCRLAQKLAEKGMVPADHLVACDLFEAHYQCREVPFQQMDANAPLPFADQSFDAVYAIEVFEHLGRPYEAMAEIHRILKPGGQLVFSVPNVLHLQSRLNFLFTGFHTLYVPPTANPQKAGNISGHVMPLSFAYLAYGLRRAGYDSIEVRADRYKRGSMGWMILFWPFIRLASWIYGQKIRNYDAEVHVENKHVLDRTNSLDMLLARSAIIQARRVST